MAESNLLGKGRPIAADVAGLGIAAHYHFAHGHTLANIVGGTEFQSVDAFLRVQRA